MVVAWSSPVEVVAVADVEMAVEVVVVDTVAVEVVVHLRIQHPLSSAPILRDQRCNNMHRRAQHTRRHTSVPARQPLFKFAQ